MNSLKICILCTYYNRPLLIRNAFNSILAANKHHTNWQLIILDDGSKVPVEPIIHEMLGSHLDQITLIQSGTSLQEKINQGLILGKYANEVIKNSDADVAIILCDDDELVPDYLKNLSDYFLENEQILYCYSKIFLYNPFFRSKNSNQNCKFNKWTGPINPVSKIDASQIAWRLKCCKEMGAWFQDTTKCVDGKPWIKDTDKSFFENLYAKCGLCHPTDFFGEFKGIHDYQLIWHKDANAVGLWSYDKMCQELSGVVF